MAMIRSEDRIAVRPSERVEAFRECEGWISGIEAVMLDSCEISKVRGMAHAEDIAPEGRAGSTGARSRTAGEGSLKRHQVAGCCRSRCRDKHCRKAGEEQRGQNPCCWFERNVSIFIDLE